VCGGGESWVTEGGTFVGEQGRHIFVKVYLTGDFL
jgi:hypothetical protein